MKWSISYVGQDGGGEAHPCDCVRRSERSKGIGTRIPLDWSWEPAGRLRRVSGDRPIRTDEGWCGASGYDAITPDGKTVQIKTNHASKTIGIRGEADLLLVLKVEADGTWEELYYGDFHTVIDIANWSKRDSKHSIPVRALQRLSESSSPQQ